MNIIYNSSYPKSLFYRSGSAHGDPVAFPLGVSFCRGALEDGPRDAAGGRSAEHEMDTLLF